MKTQIAVLKTLWFILLVSVLSVFMLIFRFFNFDTIKSLTRFMFTVMFFGTYSAIMLFLHVVNSKNYYKDFKSFFYISSVILFFEIFIILFSYLVNSEAEAHLYMVSGLGTFVGLTVLVISGIKLFKSQQTSVADEN